MNSADIRKIFYKPFINGVLIVFKMLWTTNEFKFAVIGIPVSTITFRIVGRIFSYEDNIEIEVTE